MNDHYSMLGNRIDNLLRLMQYLSHAPAAKAPDAPQVHSGKSSTQAPTMPGRTLFDKWTAEDGELALLVAKMERDLRSATHSPRSQPEDAIDFAKRVVAEHEGKHYAEAAERENVHKTHIWKIRVKAGRGGTWGEILVEDAA